MGIEELRIGNYVEYNGCTGVVSAIHSPVPCSDKEYNDIGLVELVLSGIVTARINEIQPIPLTEDLLLKFGFEKKSYVTSGIEIEIVFYQIRNIVIYLLRDFFEIEIITSYGQFNLHKTFPKKLHRLQNIIKELTGEELEIKK